MCVREENYQSEMIAELDMILKLSITRLVVPAAPQTTCLSVCVVCAVGTPFYSL